MIRTNIPCAAVTDSPRRTRLAPSPTGPLHVGNACSFLVTWALARTLGWELLLRVEDLDDARAREESVRDIGESFAWLGIDHDGPAVHQRGGAGAGPGAHGRAPGQRPRA